MQVQGIWGMHSICIATACHTLACKAKTACLRLVDLQGSVDTHIHTLRIRIYLLSCIKYHKHNVERVSTFAYRNAKVLVILQVTRVLEHRSVDNFNKLPCPETKPTQTRIDKDRQTHRHTQSCSQGCRSSSWTFGFRTHICLNYFQFSQLPDPPDTPSCFCFSPSPSAATMAIVQPCPANPHAHTHTD